jgi:hypothetical protein
LPNYTRAEARAADSRSEATIRQMVKRLQVNPEFTRCKACKRQMKLTNEWNFFCPGGCTGLVSPAKIYEEAFGA